MCFDRDSTSDRRRRPNKGCNNNVLPVPFALQIAYPDAYRLRILNGCNSRTLQLKFAR